MPIRAYVNGDKFDAETLRILGVAFEIVRSALKIEDQNEPAKEAIGRKLIELAKEGERDPDRLSERLLTLIAEAEPRSSALLLLTRSPPLAS
jgi:hypothetical protein